MNEIVSERRHVENLFYVRELLKFDLDEWVLERQAGNIVEGAEGIMDVIKNISILDEALTNVYAKMKALKE